MRVRKIPAVALVVLAAGLSLTACDGGGGTGASGGTPSSGSTDTPRPGATATATATTTASEQGAASNGTPTTVTSTAPTANTKAAAACRTAQLSFAGARGASAGELVVTLTNTGATACTMHGFPGVDLKGPDGTISAARSKVTAPDVTLRSGQATRFTLHCPPNTTGGSGVTFTTLVVTPPDETHAHTLDLAVNLPAGDGSTPAVVVDPVGAGK